MLLSELIWREDDYTFCLRASRRTKGGYITVVQQRAGGTYSIERHQWHQPLTDTWHDLDALTAQAVLFHLTREGISDAAE
jgi:hypothetical protein